MQHSSPAEPNLRVTGDDLNSGEPAAPEASVPPGVSAGAESGSPEQPTAQGASDAAAAEANDDDDEGEADFLSFRPNYSKAKTGSVVSPLQAAGSSFQRRTYDRDLVMSLRTGKTTLPDSFLANLSMEEQRLVLQGEEAEDVISSPPSSPRQTHGLGPGLPSSSSSSSSPLAGAGSVGGGGGEASSSASAASPSQPPLRPGKGAWIAPSAIGNLGMSSESKIVAAAKGIFNKLTRQTFEKLSDELVALLNKHPGQLEEFVNIIFETACLEPAFCALYARLCVKMSLEYQDGQGTGREDIRKKVLRVVLDKCQAEFESNEKADKEREAERASKAAREREKSLAVMEGDVSGNSASSVGSQAILVDKEREQELEQRLRMKKLGNVTFMGELFRLRMIPEKVIHGCIIYLLRNVKAPLEEDVEHLCRLLTIAGKEVDTPRARSYVDQYFSRISQLARRPTLPSRLRFMLQDIIELRASGWSEIRQGAFEDESFSTTSKGAPPLRAGPAPTREVTTEAVLLSSSEVARIKQEMRFIVEEYVVSEDVDEVVLSIRDLKFGERSVEFRAIFVYMSMIFAMERGSREQGLISKAFTCLKEANLLSASDFIKSWSKIIEELSDIEADIMFVRSYLADFIVSAITTGCVTQSQFEILLEKHKTEHSDNCRAVYEMVADLLARDREKTK